VPRDRGAARPSGRPRVVKGGGGEMSEKAEQSWSGPGSSGTQSAARVPRKGSSVCPPEARGDRQRLSRGTERV